MAERQRAKRAELVREEVIDAALAEFAERGYHQTSISHIAEAARVRAFDVLSLLREQAGHRRIRGPQVNGRLMAAIGDLTPGILNVDHRVP